MAPEPFSVALTPHRSEVVVAVRGALELSTCTELDDALRELRRSGCAEIVMDLTEVGFIDSAGLQSLLVLRNDAKRTGCRLTLVPPCAQGRRIFELTGTHGLFDWRATA